MKAGFVTTVVALAATTAPLVAQAPGLLGTWTAPGPVSGWRFADPTATVAGSRLMLVDDGGLLRLGLLQFGSADGDGGPFTFDAATLQLAHPATTLLAVASFGAGSEPALVVADEAGVAAVAMSGPGFAAGPTVLEAAAVHGYRTVRPQFAQSIVRDVDDDGDDDLLLPQRRSIELWRARDSGYEKVQSVAVEVRLSFDETANGVSDDLACEIEVPGLDLRDVTGDDRPDLVLSEGLVKRYEIQGADGRFGARSVEVDLARFQDRSASSSVELGETAVLGDRQVLQERDLTGDGVPDHVIAHKRRIWVFHGAGPDSEAPGPQFDRPVQALRVAEDATFILLLRADADERPDLVVFKLTVPSATELALGLVGSVDIDLVLLGYPCGEDGRFARSPSVRRSLTIRLPSLTTLLQESENIVERFLETVRKFRWTTFGDFDGDGRGDVAMLDEDETRLETWGGRAKEGPDADMSDGFEEFIRRILFEHEDTVFDIDRVLGLLAELFDRRSASLVDGAEPDSSIPLPEHGRVFDLVARDLDGDGRDEIMLVHAPDGTPRRFSWTVFGRRP